MITFKAIIIPNNRRKDGTYPVKIRVTFKGVSRRLATTLICTPNDLTRTLKIKSADILNKSDSLIGQMRDAIKDISPFDLENKDVDWVVSHIKGRLSEDSFKLDFFEWADKYLLTKTETTRKGYETAVNAFARYLGKRKVDINAISKSMILDFLESLDNEPKLFYDTRAKEYKKTKICKSKNASTIYISNLGHIFNAAKDRYNDEDAGRILIPKSPFQHIKKNKVTCVGQKNIGQELMQKIISYQTDDARTRMALDAFIVSFGTMGANMADLYDARPCVSEWRYYRAKTKGRRSDQAEMRVTIPDVLRPYLERLKGSRSHWLNLCDTFASKDVATTCINRALRSWCKENDVQPFTFYAARHTWATLARQAGMEKATIDDCLCHIGEYSMADIYAEKSWELVQDANRVVLSLFTW